MTDLRRAGAAEPFFLNTRLGQRYCLYYPPAPSGRHLYSLIYVHPFAEELNRSRSVAARQARAFADAGIAVLQIDLLGCGDSSGDFGDAQWSYWKDDLAAAWDWLEQRSSAPIGLWGLRLGALLALDFAQAPSRQIDKLIFWKPVVNGEGYLTQFLRVHLANQMLMGPAEKKVSVADLRNTLRSGQAIEVAGYELAPELAANIDSLILSKFAVANTPIHWFDTVPTSELVSNTAVTEIVSEWRADRINVTLHPVHNPAFWAIEGLTDNTALITATTSIFAQKKTAEQNDGIY